AARQDLAALLHELRQNIGALVVDEVHLLDTKLAHLFLAEILPLSTAWSARTSGTAWSALATWPAMTAARSAVSTTRPVPPFAALLLRRAAGSWCLFLFL